MIGQMVIAIRFFGFNHLWRTVTPVFLLMDCFLYPFSALSEKMKKIYRLEVWIFCKMLYEILFFLALCSLVRPFQMPLFTQQTHFYKNKTKIVCLRWLTFDVFSYKPLWAMLKCVCQFIKIRVVFHTLYVWNKDSDPLFLHFCHDCLICVAKESLTGLISTNHK